jgi:hypothetical protein
MDCYFLIFFFFSFLSRLIRKAYKGKWGKFWCKQIWEGILNVNYEWRGWGKGRGGENEKITKPFYTLMTSGMPRIFDLVGHLSCHGYGDGKRDHLHS